MSNSLSPVLGLEANPLWQKERALESVSRDFLYEV